LESFFADDERFSYDPFLLPDMHQAVARIYQALLSGESIAVYGDFDADGITATALLVQGLSSLGVEAIPYIPHRLTEGHGLKTAALEELRHRGVSLVITVDCGITGLPEVKKAKRIGLDVIITDHHIVPESIPPAVAVVNPKRADSAYPFLELAGVGVALKLLQALFRSIGREEKLNDLLDLAAIGTAADMVPLLEENRYLVKRGLKLINAAPRLGLREMIAQAGLSGSIDTDGITWVLAPRLNAAGRLAHALSSYKLLVTDSPQEAEELSMWLEQKNADRQTLTSKVKAKVREQILAEGISPLLMACDSEYSVGIAGLVASRISEEFYRPAVVVQVGKNVSSGSCRSINEFDITMALTRCSHLLSHYGGHSRAAGFTLPTKNLPRLQQELLDLATAQLEGLDLRPHIDIDAELALTAFRGDIFRTIQTLAPFGYGNPAPAFVSRAVEVVECRTMGNGGEHLKLKLRQGGIMWDGVGFGMGKYLAEMRPPLDIVYNLEADRWGGVEKLRLNILDFAPS